VPAKFGAKSVLRRCRVWDIGGRTGGWDILLMVLAGWINRRRRDVIVCLMIARDVSDLSDLHVLLFQEPRFVSASNVEVSLQ